MAHKEYEVFASRPQLEGRLYQIRTCSATYIGLSVMGMGMGSKDGELLMVGSTCTAQLHWAAAGEINQAKLALCITFRRR